VEKQSQCDHTGPSTHDMPDGLTHTHTHKMEMLNCHFTHMHIHMELTTCQYTHTHIHIHMQLHIAKKKKKKKKKSYIDGRARGHPPECTNSPPRGPAHTDAQLEIWHSHAMHTLENTVWLHVGLFVQELCWVLFGWLGRLNEREREMSIHMCVCVCV
jgi:hypothetical protein